jgi:hypothetical protein
MPNLDAGALYPYDRAHVRGGGHPLSWVRPCWARGSEISGRIPGLNDALRLRHSLAVAPTATHYDVTAAYQQKVQALALRSETQARDVFDMNWLLARDPEACALAPAKNAQAAADRAIELAYDDFSAQVVPFLDREDAAIYGTKEAWNQMVGHVVQDLLGRADSAMASKGVS